MPCIQEAVTCFAQTSSLMVVFCFEVSRVSSNKEEKKKQEIPSRQLCLKTSHTLLFVCCPEAALIQELLLALHAQTAGMKVYAVTEAVFSSAKSHDAIDRHVLTAKCPSPK
nr:MAG: hypothetical protein [Molluscum contagiosum virus]